MMSFSLKLHLRQVQREEKKHSYDLSSYTSFITDLYSAITLIPQLMQGVGIEGPPYQTIKHNNSFLANSFPMIRKEFAESIVQDINFKLKDITSEILAQIQDAKATKHRIHESFIQAQKKQICDKFAKNTKENSKKSLAPLFNDAQAKKIIEATKQIVEKIRLSEQSTDISWTIADEFLSEHRKYGKMTRKNSIEKATIAT